MANRQIKETMGRAIRRVIVIEIKKMVGNGIQELVGVRIEELMGKTIKDVLKDIIEKLGFKLDLDGLIDMLKGSLKTFFTNIIEQITGGELFNTLKKLIDDIKNGVDFTQIQKNIGNELIKIIDPVKEKLLGDGETDGWQSKISGIIEKLIGELTNGLDLSKVIGIITAELKKQIHNVATHLVRTLKLSGHLTDFINLIKPKLESGGKILDGFLDKQLRHLVKDITKNIPEEQRKIVDQEVDKLIDNGKQTLIGSVEGLLGGQLDKLLGNSTGDMDTKIVQLVEGKLNELIDSLAGKVDGKMISDLINNQLNKLTGGVLKNLNVFEAIKKWVGGELSRLIKEQSAKMFGSNVNSLINDWIKRFTGLEDFAIQNVTQIIKSTILNLTTAEDVLHNLAPNITTHMTDVMKNMTKKFGFGGGNGTNIFNQTVCRKKIN